MGTAYAMEWNAWQPEATPNFIFLILVRIRMSDAWVDQRSALSPLIAFQKLASCIHNTYEPPAPTGCTRINWMEWNAVFVHFIVRKPRGLKAGWRLGVETQ
jgi:hypothetical protein